MRVTLFIDGPSDFFCSWIEEHTKSVFYRSFPIEKGRISLQRARHSRTPGYIGMQGIYHTVKDENTEIAYPVSEIIRFKIIPLTPNRTEIEAECSQPVVEKYFLHLLSEISRRWPQPPDVEARLIEIEQTLKTGFADVKRGRAALYHHLNNESQLVLNLVLEELRQGRIEQGQLQRTVNSIRRVLISVQNVGLPVNDKEVIESLDDIYRAVNSDLTLQQKVELSIPVIPLLLQYKIELGAGGAGVDLAAVWEELINRTHKKVVG